MGYVGDYMSGAMVMIYFNTFSSDDPSASVTITNFVNTDVHIHRLDDLTQRNNAAGVTVDVDVDGITGNHSIKIDLSDNTVTDFYIPGYDYGVRIEGTTVDAATINAFVGHFSIENRYTAGIMARSNIATLASQTSFTLESGEASGDDDAYNGCVAVVTKVSSKIQKCVGYISDYTGSSRTVTLAADPGIFTMAVDDHVAITAGANVNAWLGAAVNALVSGRVDADIGAKTGNVPLSTQEKLDVNAEADTALSDYDPPTNAEMEARTIVAANYFDPAADNVTVATGGITAASIATDAVDADALATDAVNEIADGQFTRQMTEAYKTAGTAPTLAQAIFEILQNLTDFAFSGTTKTVRKLDASTAKTYTLDDGTNPTDITETT